MKKHLQGLALFVVMAVTLTAVGAFASGNFPWTRNKTLAPNVTAIAPEKGKSGCVTQTLTKGTFGTYTSTSGYLVYEGEVVTATGAPEVVKWEVDGNRVATGSSFRFTNSGGNTYSRAVQRVYSAPSRSLTSCIRRQ